MCSNFLPKLQRGVLCRNFASYSMLFILSWWPKEGAMAQHPPPKYQRWSPRERPWPRGRPRGHILKSLTLASKPQVLGLGLEALGPRKLPSPRLEENTMFEPLKFCRKTPETSRKICKYLFYFAQLEHRLSQPGLPPQLKFYQWQKCDKKAYCFFSFSFFLAFFAYISSEQ